LDLCAAEAATMIYCSNGLALVSGSSPRNGFRSGMSCETRSWQTRLVTTLMERISQNMQDQPRIRDRSKLTIR
jgi:hypothetical protein